MLLMWPKIVSGFTCFVWNIEWIKGVAAITTSRICWAKGTSSGCISSASLVGLFRDFCSATHVLVKRNKTVFWRIYTFSAPLSKYKWFFEWSLSGRISLTSEWLEGLRSYLIFKSLSIRGQCPGNTKILAPKAEIQTKKNDFLENGSEYFD
jgi:hypothetical protein